MNRPSELTNGKAPARRIPKAAEIFAEEIKRQILGHGLETGSALPSESELIANSGLGRASVREAIRLLESEGLIEIRRGALGGIFVREPDGTALTRSLALVMTMSKAPLRDLCSYRKMVEPPAASLAAESADQAGRDALLALAQHVPEFGYTNEVDFHVQVAMLSGNHFLQVLLMVPNELLRAHLAHEKIDSDDVEEANQAHRSIALAIAKGDGVKAGRAMIKHLDSFERRLDKMGTLDRPIVPRESWLREE
jgi:GntR family transcriptional regulator, transcriptional repressor for pyruvate dehydrogenase complex